MNIEERQKNKIWLIDGSGYIFRAYYATPFLCNSQGLPTNAIYGFTRMLLNMLKNNQPKYLAVAFDTAGPNFRHKVYPEYKKNRKESPEDLLSQMPWFRKIVSAMGIPYFEREDVEADDIIATFARTMESKGLEVEIVSTDKDLAQLVSENIVLFDPMRNEKLDRKLVFEKFGVYPEQLADYLALAGDTSDNIPGVSGVGQKTAIKLLGALRSLDEIMANPEAIIKIDGLRGRKSIVTKVEEALDLLTTFRKLTGLVEDLEPFFSYNVSDLEISEPDSAQLLEIFSELDFMSMVGVEEFLASNRVKRETIETTIAIVYASDWPEFLEQLKKAKNFSLDLETTEIDPHAAKIVGASFSLEPEKAFYVPFMAPCRDKELLSVEIFLETIKSVLESEEIGVFGSNLKFDSRVLLHHGIKLRGIAGDTMLAAHVLHPDKRGYGLKQLSKELLGLDNSSFQEVLQDYKRFDEVPLERAAIYAGQDSDYALRVINVLHEELQKSGNESLWKGYKEVELPLVSVLSQMEDNGIFLDVEYLKKMECDLDLELFQVQSEIYRFAGREFNLNSPKQLSQLLFEEFALPTAGIKKTKASWSTDARSLEILKPHHEIISYLIKYREIFKLQSTYVKALQHWVEKGNFRIHASFNQAITATGRLSSSDPNLQNIPIKGERANQLRRAFVPEEGKLFLSADYSQIELRVLAHFCEDEALLHAFSCGGDVHRATAERIFPGKEIDKNKRRIAKTINFGVIYGISPFRLAKELEITRHEAKQFIDSYFETYCGVREYFENLDRQIEQSGYAETLLGRRRYRSEINSSGRDAGYVMRSLRNFPIQGTAAEIIKMAMISFCKIVEEKEILAKLLLQVHDELVVEVEKGQIEDCRIELVRAMEGACDLKVPLFVDVKQMSSWGQELL